MGYKSRGSKVLSLVITVLMLGGIFTVPVYGEDFFDIGNHWAKESIEKFVENEIVSGYPDNTFKPNNPISRAESAAIINNNFGYYLRDENNFSDVKEGKWYFNQII